jgi:hypothetical protein
MSANLALDLSLSSHTDRRASGRYPVSMELTYRVLGGDQMGAGRTLEIGSGGLSFSAPEPLTPGTVIEVSLDWPALLEDACPLKMVVKGRVLRSHNRLTAIEIRGYEFHTRRRAPSATVSNLGSSCLRPA